MTEKTIGAYQAIQIKDGAWRIEDEYVRFFLLEGTERALLVDAGFGRGDVPGLVKELTGKPVQIVVTHADFDHIGGSGGFGEVSMHPSEYLYYLQQLPEAHVSPLWDGDILDLGGVRYEVILLPGHTPGSISLFDAENGVLVSGDNLSDVPVYIFGKMRNLRAYIDSLTKLQGLKSGILEIWPSHGSFPLSTDAIDRQKAAALKLLAGGLEGHEAPNGLPAKMYLYEGAGYYY
ncbi:MAG: MBL fold metallo-hydrolase [Clostridiales Family XIII bacterium]|jgi:glyoxylase-like metal-dependent hydrolase (beta-lactamase superfamily II)|nr:MBL fold metallo-hydrolase [Clostridiales Family XIII bacterium]